MVYLTRDDRGIGARVRTDRAADMKLDLNGIFVDAWAMAKRDRDLLVGVAGAFLFVPQLAMAMFVAPPPVWPGMSADSGAINAWLEGTRRWSESYSLGVIALALVAMFGTLALLTLYVDRERPDVRGALPRALPLLPRLLLLSLLVSVPVTAGLLLLLLPGIYLQGRLLLANPALVAARPMSAVAAFQRSFALTRGYGLPLAGLACITIFGGDLLALPFRALGTAMDGAPMANPFVAAVLDIGAAAGVTIGNVAAILVQVALYRRLASNNGM